MSPLRYRVDPTVATDRDVRVTFVDTGNGDEVTAHLRNSVLRVSAGADASAQASLRLARDVLAAFCSGSRGWDDIVDSGDVTVEGNAEAVSRFATAFDLAPPVAYLHLPSAPTNALRSSDVNPLHHPVGRDPGCAAPAGSDASVSR